MNKDEIIQQVNAMKAELIQLGITPHAVILCVEYAQFAVDINARCELLVMVLHDTPLDTAYIVNKDDFNRLRGGRLKQVSE